MDMKYLNFSSLKYLDEQAYEFIALCIKVV